MYVVVTFKQITQSKVQSNKFISVPCKQQDARDQVGKTLTRDQEAEFHVHIEANA